MNPVFDLDYQPTVVFPQMIGEITSTHTYQVPSLSKTDLFKTGTI